jgi:tetratricopeptide (TPR) repeat protein
MKLLAYILLFWLGVTALHGGLFGQEEESAAVSLEDVTDEFQESFFEALKQKGIENYDKAINHLLECKRLDPANPVVDHELAKAYGANGQSLEAMEYGIAALNTEPSNLWYLETLVSATLQQGNTVDILKDRIPYANKLLRENLARVFFWRKDYQAALGILNDLNKSDFSVHLATRIRDSLKHREEEAKKEEEEVNPMEAYRRELQQLLEDEAYGTLEPPSLEALENFPSFPFFYYVRGMVLNHNKQYQAAAAVLEEGLNYLLDDPVLEGGIYKALAAAYTGMGNTSKANMYLSKLKSGS